MKLINFLWSTSKPFKHFLCGSLLCTLLTAIDSNLRPYIIKLIINEEEFNISNYILLGGAYIVCQMIMALVAGVNDWLGTLFHTNYRRRIARLYLERLTQYPYTR